MRTIAIAFVAIAAASLAPAQMTPAARAAAAPRLDKVANLTPDNKWVVFGSNMFGPTYVFAVEVAKTQSGEK